MIRAGVVVQTLPLVKFHLGQQGQGGVQGPHLGPLGQGGVQGLRLGPLGQQGDQWLRHVLLGQEGVQGEILLGVLGLACFIVVT